MSLYVGRVHLAPGLDQQGTQRRHVLEASQNVCDVDEARDLIGRADAEEIGEVPCGRRKDGVLACGGRTLCDAGRGGKGWGAPMAA